MTTYEQLVIPMLHGAKPFKEDCPKSPIEMEYMSRVPYVSVVGSLMYGMMCTRPDTLGALS